MKLLIVESPGKLKTLRKILGAGWILEASVGHTTELASDGVKNLGFEIGDSEVVTRYVPRGDRGKQVLAKLRAAVKQADEIYLAMDPDREGEAIAWHLVEQLRLKKYARVAYTQITESAVKAALKSPRGLDFPLVQAQRARQCLDKLVGFEVSPLLWNTTGGKSAGRVQSATLHLVCERERERLAFIPKDYWTLHSHYGEKFSAQYEPERRAKSAGGVSATGPDAGERIRTEIGAGSAKGDRTSAGSGFSADEPARVESAEEAARIEQIAKSHPHVVSSVEDFEEKRLPQPPLITSSLQQMASMRLKMSPQRTMQVAQELYEGIGGNGLITYMRTDAVSLSPEFIADARDWLSSNAPEALADRAPVFKSKGEAQGAHEAIRPTSVSFTPEKARSLLSAEQAAVYKLIWDRAVASQCRPARLAKTRVEIMAEKTRWVARGLRIVEQGYLQFWNNIEEEHQLPALKRGQTLRFQSVKVEKKTTQPPSRYSEAKLVQLMEKLGIGRPSTYASTVNTLKERGYVVLEKGVLAPTALGMDTDEVLTKAIPDLVSVQFTAHMEESLDQIAENKIGWEKFLCDWNSGYFKAAVISAKNAIRGMPRTFAEGGGFGGGSGLSAGSGSGSGSRSGNDFGAGENSRSTRGSRSGRFSGSRAGSNFSSGSFAKKGRSKSAKRGQRDFSSGLESGRDLSASESFDSSSRFSSKGKSRGSSSKRKPSGSWAAVYARDAGSARTSSSKSGKGEKTGSLSQTSRPASSAKSGESPITRPAQEPRNSWSNRSVDYESGSAGSLERPADLFSYAEQTGADSSVGFESQDWSSGLEREVKSLASKAPRKKRAGSAAVARAPRAPSRKVASPARPKAKKKVNRKSRSSPRQKKALNPADAPQCDQGHGPLQARISKKGDPYWKCGEHGCTSWHWPN